MTRIRRLSSAGVAAMLLLLPVGGCATRPAWHDDPAAGQPAFWLARPAAVAVESDDYRSLWDAADDARRRFGFDVRVSDYAGGRVVTEPLVGAQPFEPWRDEMRTVYARTEAALANTRRTVEFTLHETPGGYRIEPRVVVERQTLADRRITNAVDYRAVLGPGRQRGTREEDLRRPVVRAGWYAVGRDPALERSLADRIARRAGGRVVAGGRPVTDPAG